MDDREVEQAAYGGCNDKHLGLLATGLAGDKHLGGRGRLRERQVAVHVAHEVSPKGDQEQHTEYSPQEGDQEELEQVDREAENEQTRNGEYGAGNDQSGGGANRLDDHVLEKGRAPAEDHTEADSEDGNRDCRLKHLTYLEAEEGGGCGENCRHYKSNTYGPKSPFWHPFPRRHDRNVGLAGLQLAVRVLRKRAVGGLHWAVPPEDDARAYGRSAPKSKALGACPSNGARRAQGACETQTRREEEFDARASSTASNAACARNTPVPAAVPAARGHLACCGSSPMV